MGQILIGTLRRFNGNVKDNVLYTIFHVIVLVPAVIQRRSHYYVTSAFPVRDCNAKDLPFLRRGENRKTFSVHKYLSQGSGLGCLKNCLLARLYLGRKCCARYLFFILWALRWNNIIILEFHSANKVAEVTLLLKLYSFRLGFAQQFQKRFRFHNIKYPRMTFSAGAIPALTSGSANSERCRLHK